MVLAIVALVAIFVVAYNKSETFRRIVDGVFRAVQKIVGQVVGFITDLFADLGDFLAEPFEALVGIVRVGVRDHPRHCGGRGGVHYRTSWVASGTPLGRIVEALPGGQMVPPSGAGRPASWGAGPGRHRPPRGRSWPPGAAGHLEVEATLTHRIEDPGRALAGLPGGAAEVARILNRGADATGLFRNLQHAARTR